MSHLLSRFSLFAVFCMLLPLSSAAYQTPVWVSLDAPDSTATFPQSINDLMVVTGYYTPKWSPVSQRGFVRDANGSITTFAVPGAAATIPVSINHSGDITGYYYVPSPNPIDEPTFFSAVPQGFVRAADGTFTTFGNAPGGLADSHTTWFIPVAINNAGEIVGNENNAQASMVFLRSPSGTLEEFSLVVGPGVENNIVAGINASGAIVGYTQQGFSNYQGFLWSGNGALPASGANDITTIIAGGGEDLNNPSLSVQTTLNAVNASGEIVGCYAKLGYSFDFVRNQEGTIATLDLPKQKGCDITINDAGTIAGSYINEAYVASAFIIPPHGKVSFFSYPGAISTTTTSLNNLDVITGYYSKGATTHGFILVPGN